MKIYSDHMPVLFVGHGNPMYAITNNIYRETWMKIGAELVKPKAILCISAHWITRNTFVCMVDKPKTIHDFGGFPEALYQQQYPAPGAKELAKLVVETIGADKISKDYAWGLDHGAWSVLMNMFSKADIPVFQMSMDYTKPPEYHYNLARELAFLRLQGVLVVCSGNIVHNIKMASWEKDVQPYDWTVEFDEFVKTNIETGNHQSLVDYQQLGRIAGLAHPTNEHYLPLLYAIGLQDKRDDFKFFNDTLDMASMSMRSVIFSQA